MYVFCSLKNKKGILRTRIKLFDDFYNIFGSDYQQEFLLVILMVSMWEWLNCFAGLRYLQKLHLNKYNLALVLSFFPLSSLSTWPPKLSKIFLYLYIYIFIFYIFILSISKSVMSYWNSFWIHFMRPSLFQS